MATWVDLGAEPDARRLEGDIDGWPVAAVNVAGAWYAFEDRCTHDDGALADAEVECEPGRTPVVICPRHGARFCLERGDALSPPAYEPIKVFATRVHEGRVQVWSEPR